MHHIQFWTIDSAINKHVQTPNIIYSPQHMLWFCIFGYTKLNIDIWKSKQSKTVIVNVNTSNGEIFSVIGALVVDICQRIQNSKTLFLSNTAAKQPLKKLSNNVFSVCVRWYISTTKAPIPVKVSLFELLILVVAVLDCFGLEISISNIMLKYTKS